MCRPPKCRSAGSSPHTRGARQSVASVTPHRGIIPAYAGSTPGPGSRPGARTDHPRIRGEHTQSAIDAEAAAGSSPHTRGALPQAFDDALADGIIPAYAGSTSMGAVDDVFKSDHPRIRGEHTQAILLGLRRRGSSPHTRGALSLARGASWRYRIIPAYAGSTPWLRSGLRRLADHPRIRGEHHLHARSRLPRHWIIPAYAGSTSSCSSAGVR